MEGKTNSKKIPNPRHSLTLRHKLCYQAIYHMTHERSGQYCTDKVRLGLYGRS